MIYVYSKLQFDKAWNTWNIWAKTLKTRLQTQNETRKVEETRTPYVFKLEVLKLDEPGIPWKVSLSKHYTMYRFSTYLYILYII